MKKLPKEQTILVSIEEFVNLKSEVLERRTGRPMVMPPQLTPKEYNWLVGYMNEQHALLNGLTLDKVNNDKL